MIFAAAWPCCVRCQCSRELTGSAGGGKSRLAAEKINGFCLRYPGATAVALRKTRNSMTNSTALFLERTVIGKSAHHYTSKSRLANDGSLKE